MRMQYVLTLALATNLHILAQDVNVVDQRPEITNEVGYATITSDDGGARWELERVRTDRYVLRLSAKTGQGQYIDSIPIWLGSKYGYEFIENPFKEHVMKTPDGQIVKFVEFGWKSNYQAAWIELRYHPQNGLLIDESNKHAWNCQCRKAYERVILTCQTLDGEVGHLSVNPMQIPKEGMTWMDFPTWIYRGDRWGVMVVVTNKKTGQGVTVRKRGSRLQLEDAMQRENAEDVVRSQLIE